MFTISKRVAGSHWRGVSAVFALFCFSIPSSVVRAQTAFSPPQALRNAARNELLIGLTEAADRAGGEKIIAGIGTKIRHFALHHAYHLKIKPGTDLPKLMARLQETSGVAYVESNHVVSHTDAIALPNDPAFANGQGAQWAPLRTATALAWNVWQPKNTKPIVIAVVDSGVDDAHPDLTNMMLRDANGKVLGYNALTDTVGPTPPDFPHGTHVAGIAAAQTNNGQGISGIAGWSGDSGSSDTAHIKIMPVKVLDATGNGTTANVAAGIDWAVAHGANIINLSLGGPDPDLTLYRAIQNAWTKNVLVVAAAGNYGNSANFYPAAVTNVVSVAATVNNAADSLPTWSNRGWWVTVSAPGDGIISTYPNHQYVYNSGTSMAAPHVAGIAALVWAQNPLLKNFEVVRILVASADKYPASNNPIAKGGGRVNAYAALQAVSAALPTLSGTITLPDCVNVAQKISMEFRSLDGALDFTHPVLLTPTAPGSSVGAFAAPGLPNVPYTVSIQGANWLRKTAPLAAPLTAAPLSVTLSGGDANGDNSCNVLDFGVLINAYGSRLSDPNSGFDPLPDFNNDGVVDVLDFGILVNDYGLQGDP